MFGGFAVALGDPLHRWVSGLICIGTLLAIAWYLRLPVLHIPMQLCLGILCVSGATFDIDALIESPAAGLRLTGLLAAQAFGAEVWMRLYRPRDARVLAVGSGVSTVIAALLVLPHALTDPGMVALVLGSASLIWGTANLRWRLAEITYVCCLFLAGAIFFTFRAVDDSPVPQQLLWSLLVQASVSLIGATVLRFVALDWVREFFRVPLQFAALFATFFGAGILLIETARFGLPWGVSALACFWLAGLWLALAALLGWSILFGAFQIALGAAWFFIAADRLTALGWDWREPCCLHVYAVGIGVLCLATELTRIVAANRPRVLALVLPAFLPVDRVCSVGLLLGQYVLAALLVLWPVGRELVNAPESWRVFPLAWYDSAYSIWPWILLAVLMGTLILWLRRIDLRMALVGFVIVLLTVPLLVAGRGSIKLKRRRRPYAGAWRFATPLVRWHSGIASGWQANGWEQSPRWRFARCSSSARSCLRWRSR